MEEHPTLHRLDAQIKLLQQRNLEWARETAALLDDEVRQAQAPLEAEIGELHQLIQDLRNERSQLVNQLEHAEESSNKRLQLLSQQISQNFQEVLGQGLVVPSVHELPTPKTPVMTAVAREIPKKKEPKPKRKITIHHHLLMPIAAIVMLIALGYLVIDHLPKGVLSTNQMAALDRVAGVSTSKPVLPEFQSLDQQYPESYATVSFADTKWATYSDSDFGISIQYPKNATNLVHEVGGDNLWFLRGDGYLMKISKIDIPATQTLDAWWTANQTEYLADVPATQSTFKGVEAWYIPSAERTSVSGSTYYIKEGAEIYQIWVKDEPTTTDDGKRLQQMITSLQFTS